MVMEAAPFDLPDHYHPNIHIGQLTAVFDTAKWYAFQGDQVYVYGYGTPNSGTITTIVSRTVPSGKTMYITHIGWACVNATITSTIAWLRVDGTTVSIAGQEVGGSIVFDTPIRATEGLLVELRVEHFVSPSSYVGGSIGGYDI